jgi:hypothetical protein
MTGLLTDIRALARALGGDVVGRNTVNMQGPGHSRRDRSLSVTVNRDAPDGFLVKSRCGDDDLRCKDYVRSLLGLPPWAPADNSRPALSLVRTPPAPSPEEQRHIAWKQARVRATWEEAVDPRGTIVETYLASRRLMLPDEVAGAVLRFHPACPWTAEDGSDIRVPAMVAAMRDIATDELKAVHRTRLTVDGRKVDRRMFGAAAGTAIKLDPDEVVTMGLVVGEGIETALSARQLGFRPAWALGSVGAIARFPVLSGIEGLTLLAETDKTGANAKAIKECGTRWDAAGRVVVLVKSKCDGDMNDALKALKGRAA